MLAEQALPDDRLRPDHFPEDIVGSHAADYAARDGGRKQKRMQYLMREEIPFAIHGKAHGSEQGGAGHHGNSRRNKEHRRGRLHDLSHRFRVQGEAHCRYESGADIAQAQGIAGEVNAPAQHSAKASPVKPRPLDVEQYRKTDCTEESRDDLNKPRR